MRKIISSVDLGSDTIKIVVSEIIKEKVHVLAAISSPSDGISKGIVVNENLAATSLKSAFSKITDLIGQSVKKSVVNVPINGADFSICEGTIELTSEDKIVTGKDISKVINSSVSGEIPNNMELISAIPIEFTIDNKIKVKDPKNMHARILKVKVVALTAPKINIYKTLNIFDTIGIEISDITFGCIGDYLAYSSPKTDEVSGVVINLGYETCTISVFNKGVLINYDIIDLGSSNVDADISFIYKVKKSDAIFLKENLALAHVRNAQGNDSEEINDTYGDKVKINQYEISEIVSSRIDEILKITKKRINTLTKREISYIIITGGLSETKDFSLAAQSVYGNNATIGLVNNVGLRHNKYSTALGMIKYFNNKLNLRGKEYSVFNIEELDDLSNTSRKINISSDSLLGKIFGYFFDN